MTAASRKILDGLHDALRWSQGVGSGWVNLPGGGRRKMRRVEYETWLRERDNAITVTLFPATAAE